MNSEEGRTAVRVAREALLAECEGRPYSADDLTGRFAERSGVFVTVSEYPSHDLRACIGYPETIMPLGRALVASAQGAVHDPRFPTLTPAELRGCLVEVTVLTPPRELEYTDVDDLRSRIVIGRDGLIIECDGRRGLFLPQVPVEQGWNTEQYLTGLCYKAGLPGGTWRSGRAVFRTFQGEIFEETSPGGEVVRRD